MDYSKWERLRYGVTIEEMSNLSGLAVARIEEIENFSRSLPVGRHTFSDADIADRARLGKSLDGVKNSQDDTVTAIIGNLLKHNFSVSVDAEHMAGRVESYSARIRREFSQGSVTVEGRASSRLMAVHRAIGHMSEAIAAASGVADSVSVE